MGRKIAVLTDSSASLDFLAYEYDHVFQIRLSVFFDGVEYVDGETITNIEFFRRIVEEDVIPTTSQPSIGQVSALCEQIREKGYTDIIYLPLSRGISSSYDMIMGGLDMIENINFHVVNTQSTAVYLAFMTMEAARLVEEGKDIDEVISHINYLRDNQHIYFMVDDLKYLVKNGRLSNRAGFLGGMLKIKPVLEFDENGKIVGTEKIRTTKKTLETIVGYVSTAYQKHEKIQLCICHGLDYDLLEKLKEEIMKQGLPLDQIMILPLPPVIGAHVGNGVVSFGYFVLE